MLTLRRGRVTSVEERVPGLVRARVDGRPCIAYPRLTGPVAVGDEVIVNTQARDLDLGSGGFDVLYANLTRGLDLAPQAGAHVMKLPYTPLQVAVRHAEEDGLPECGLRGLPAVACTLHSQVAAVCAGIGPGRRIAFVQLPGGALPVSLSDSLRALRRAGLIELTLAPGPCLDGDLACVSTAAALQVAAARGMDVVVCGVGPGIAGTGTALGHGAISAAEALNAAGALGGRPVLAPRISQADARERHRELSHHTASVLSLTAVEVLLAWPRGAPVQAPAGVTEVDASGWEEACAGLALESMGRGTHDDPWFFAAAFAAGRLAGDLLDGAA